MSNYYSLYNICEYINGDDKNHASVSNRMSNQLKIAENDSKKAILPFSDYFAEDNSDYDYVIGDFDYNALIGINDNLADNYFNINIVNKYKIELNIEDIKNCYTFKKEKADEKVKVNENYLYRTGNGIELQTNNSLAYGTVCKNMSRLFPVRTDYNNIKDDNIKLLHRLKSKTDVETKIDEEEGLILVSIRVILPTKKDNNDITNTNYILGIGYIFQSCNNSDRFFYYERKRVKTEYFNINFPIQYSNIYGQVRLKNDSENYLIKYVHGIGGVTYQTYCPLLLNLNTTDKANEYKTKEEFNDKFSNILLGIKSKDEITVAEQEKELALEQINEVKAVAGIINKADNLNAYEWDYNNVKYEFKNNKNINLSIEDEKKIFSHAKPSKVDIKSITKESKEKGTKLINVKLINIKCNIFKASYLEKSCCWVVLNPVSDDTKSMSNFSKSKNGIIFSYGDTDYLYFNKFYFNNSEKVENEKNKFKIPYSVGSSAPVLDVEAYGDEIESFEIDCVDKRSSDRELVKVLDKIYDNKKDYDKQEGFFKYEISRLDSNKEPEDSTTGKSRAEIENFIKSWSCKIDTGNLKEQYGYDIDRYYDMFSGMTPYVKLGFANKSSENIVWNYIDSVYSPFIQSLSIKDNGVKTITLKLYDKDFASYNKLSFETIDAEYLHPNDKGRTNAIYSLEDLLRKSLKSENFDSKNGNKEDRQTYENKDEQLIDEFLKIEKSQTNLTANLSVRFGYCDYNQPLTATETKIDNKGNVKENSIKEDSGDDSLTNYFKQKGSTQRNNRWWSFTDAETKTYPITFEDKLIKGDKIEHNGGKQINNKESTTGIYREKQINSTVDQTTSMSQEIEFMITGFKTTLQNNGLVYEITAIEQKDCEIIGNRFLQRFAVIKSFPNDVLYMLMHIFNETTGGANVDSSKVKILLGLDEEYAKNFGYKLVEKIDTKKLSNNKEMIELFDSDYLDTYNIKNEKDVSPEILEQITLSFGTESSFSNFIKSSEKPPLYKSISSLISEFCSACPPKKKISVKPKIYNKDGEEVNVYDQNAVSAPLSYFTVKDQKEDIVYIVLYYRNVRKPGIIRVYNWGVESPYQHCITNLSIENSNEFAILNGINCFSANDGKIRRRIGSINPKNGSDGAINANSKEVSTEDGKMVNQITYTTNASDSYDIAYSSSMYNGTIEILGDPFYMFDEYMQPCTYPILLNVLVPLNELAFTSEAEEWKRSKTVVKGGNQRLHELSGYYVIKEINHDISKSGFKTTLTVMSYPNIQNDVLINGDTLQMR